jgi:hypothetical protein
MGVRGAKPRADLTQSHIVPQLDARKWRDSVPLVPIVSACCTCVPTLLPLLRHRPGEGDFHNRSITLATLALRTSVPRDDRIARLPAAAALNSVLDTS